MASPLLPLCPATAPYDRAPEQLLPALPYLVGYRPCDSLVAVFLHDDRTLSLSARLDWDVCRADPVATADAVLQQALRSTPRYVLVAAVDPTQSDPQALAAFAQAMSGAGLTVIWAGVQHGDTWRTVECDALGCGVHRLDPGTPPPLVLSLIADGRAPLRDREAIADEVTPEPGGDRDRVAAVRRPRGVDREAWRDHVIRSATDILSRGPGLTAADTGVFAAACADVRVRDVLLWRLTRGPEHVLIGWGRAWEVAAEVLRRCTTRDVAAVAAVASVIAWNLGDGIRASACLARAEAADPDHSLAALVRRSLAAGCPPTVWGQVMGGLTEEQCRHGSD